MVLQVLRRMAQDLLMVPSREPLPFLIEPRIMAVPLEDGSKVRRCPKQPQRHSLIQLVSHPTNQTASLPAEQPNNQPTN